MENVRLKRAYVYDLCLRIFHAWIGLSTLLLIITGLYASNLEPGAAQASVWIFHIGIGKFLVLGVVGRFIWGFIGPRFGRWSQFWHWREWMRTLKTRTYKFQDEKFGHEASASLAYLGFYFLTIIMILTGLVLAGVLHGKGPFAKTLFDDLEAISLPGELHEWGGWFIISFVLIHIVALAFHERRESIPLGQSMISGFQYRKSKGADK